MLQIALMKTEDVIEVLRKRQGEMSLREYARIVGCSHSYLYDLYNGGRSPGNKIMKFLGLKKRRVVETSYVKAR